MIVLIRTINVVFIMKLVINIKRALQSDIPIVSILSMDVFCQSSFLINVNIIPVYSDTYKKWEVITWE